MDFRSDYYSPHIVIYFQVGEQKVRLADVLNDTATIYSTDFDDVPPGTSAFLVIEIDGEKRRKQVLLDQGVSKYDKLVSFSHRTDASSVEFDDFFS